MNQQTICDICGTAIPMNRKKIWLKNLEYQYLHCPACRKLYVISVTDEELRATIHQYHRIQKAIADNTATPELRRLAPGIYAGNMKKSRELRETHPLTYSMIHQFSVYLQIQSEDKEGR